MFISYLNCDASSSNNSSNSNSNTDICNNFNCGSNTTTCSKSNTNRDCNCKSDTCSNIKCSSSNSPNSTNTNSNSNSIADSNGNCNICNDINCSSSNGNKGDDCNYSNSVGGESCNCNCTICNNINCSSSNCPCSSSNTPAAVFGMERLLHAVREEFQTEDEYEEELDVDRLHRSSISSCCSSNSDSSSCHGHSDGSNTSASQPLPPTLPTPRRRLQRSDSFGSVGGGMAGGVAGAGAAGGVRRFRRSSIGMQRKSAFRQRKLDSLGAWRRKRRTASASNSRRPIRIVPDWTENAVQGEHYWKPTSASGDLCCLNEECIKSGQRMKCSACQLVAHHNCIPFVNEKSTLACKPTYRDVGIRQYREQTTTHHHWVHRKLEKGKCKQCGKFFPMKQAVQSKLFGSKEIVALACAWCHEVYHNKEACFNQSKIGEECRLGNYAPIIVPPSWIVKLPTKGNFKSSIRVSNKNNAASGSGGGAGGSGGGGSGGGGGGKSKRQTQRRQKGKEEKKEPRAFIVKPIPSPEVIPVIVFINPKSGGNQGHKLLGKFQHLLNPRQVFDLTQGGPKMGLDMFRKAPNLRVLACGGDGTVGWVLSVLDQIQPPLQPAPAVGVLPLGTGNDLARALGWGGGYTDEPIGKVLREIGMSQCVLMDRWRVKVTPNEDVTDDHVDRSKPNVPLNVINNYFSFGVDAHIALEFHEAREAHPERFNSRLRNKMYYGQMGGKDLILRQYRNLSQWVTLECDGQDFTGKLRDAGCHAVLFLNIPSYGGGTHPWNDSFGASKPSIDDGLMEVVGLTTYQLPMLQAGMHGTCICQCRKARIITKRTIPMQVDGEACRVKPSVIEIELLNKALMLSKRKHGRGDVQVNPLEKMQLNILRVTMQQYEQYHYDKEMLRKLANKLGQIEIESQCDLEHVRNMLNTKFEESISYPKVSQDWCFIDSCTAEHYFRIDRAQEHLHYICDIAIDELYILDHEAATMPQTPDQERSFAAFSQRQAQTERRQLDQAQGRGPGSTDEDLQIGSKPIKVMKWKSPILEQTSDAILLAAQSGDLNMLRALHEQGYSLQSVNKNGQTALHFACKYNHRDIVKYIIASATRRLINMADKELGQTALHIAAEQNRRDICVMLVAAGAHLDSMDSGGNTPMMVAFNKNANEIATYLESKQGTQPVDGWFDD
ncbi:eye-specific diacylglycerol kinase isoform X12 [Drosophila biarmipes]|uniref:eye-specific diacylglycerol kinase isoform X12 n=1 Tax=Drosophila biarmipes TaxID=125945 RepID=UPI001CDA9ED8|nr:eye-specific diacylglycerol kinase isoform X12 [Drosophila biarmipes]XP_050744542.1 eye-specific diacylglycerol kinase isoform X12 [Drosophila biarmipes]XP_050744546.1 eye-specific diacylglycerol kinase isoform X12 [Drosophila biarmipes]XP_050744550.1 eye-specific diacylglycerol kinase isoform X12 [Drosophila biarmipes]